MLIARIEVYGNDRAELNDNMEKLINDLDTSDGYAEDGINIEFQPICIPKYVVKIEDDPLQILTLNGLAPNPGKITSVILCARCGAKKYIYERAVMYTCACHQAG